MSGARTRVDSSGGGMRQPIQLPGMEKGEQPYDSVISFLIAGAGDTYMALWDVHVHCTCTWSM